MSYALTVPLVAFALSSILAGLVLFRNRRSDSHRLFFLFLLGMALWSIFTFLMRSSPDEQHALVWQKLMTTSVTLASVAFIHFSYVYTRVKRIRWVLPFAYVELVIVLAFFPSNLIVKGIGQDAFGYYPVSGLLLYPVSLFMYFFFILGLVNFVKSYNASTSANERESYLYVIIGVMSFLVAGVSDLLSIIFGLSVPPLGLLGNILFCILSSIALLKYHFLDMRLVLRRGMSYLIVSAIIALPYVGSILLIDRLVLTGIKPYWIYLPVIFLLVVFLGPLWRWAQRIVDRLFYRERYDYLQALERFGHEAQHITDLENISSTLVGLISESLQASSAYLLLPSPSEESFIIASRYGIGKSEVFPVVELPTSSPIVQWLRRHNEPLTHEDIDVFAPLQAVSSTEKQILASISAQLYIPIKTRDAEMVAIIILGPKRSDQLYSPADSQLVRMIAGQMAMALENARLFQALRQSYEQLKSAQDHMVRTEKLRALGQMTSGIAHDFNNSLTGILGRAQLSLDEVHEGKIHRNLKIIEQTALDAAQMVRRLQDFARVRVGYDYGAVDINPVVNAALEMIQPRLTERRETENATITVNLKLGQTGPVRGSDAELREGLVNIMINAIEAMPHGGTMSIQTGQLADSAVISVSDTGVGMTSEVRNRLFEPFFTTKGVKGLGMGLSVVYGIVKRHGGEIDVTSTPQQGSVFTITLPINLTIREEKVKIEAPITGVHDAHILVVDDDEEVRTLLYEIINKAGYNVDIAGSGEQGIASVQQKSYDMVITDLGMPNVTGRDVAKAVRKVTPNVPVVLITGWGVQIDAVEEGVDGVIAKPFDRQEILAQIAKMLKSRVPGKTR